MHPFFSTMEMRFLPFFSTMDSDLRSQKAAHEVFILLDTDCKDFVNFLAHEPTHPHQPDPLVGPFRPRPPPRRTSPSYEPSYPRLLPRAPEKRCFGLFADPFSIASSAT